MRFRSICYCAFVLWFRSVSLFFLSFQQKKNNHFSSLKLHGIRAWRKSGQKWSCSTLITRSLGRMWAWAELHIKNENKKKIILQLKTITNSIVRQLPKSSNNKRVTLYGSWRENKSANNFFRIVCNKILMFCQSLRSCCRSPKERVYYSTKRNVPFYVCFVVARTKYPFERKREKNGTKNSRWR